MCSLQGLAWLENKTFAHVQNPRIVAVSLPTYFKRNLTHWGKINRCRCFVFLPVSLRD